MKISIILLQNKFLSGLAEKFILLLVRIARIRKRFNQTSESVVITSFHKLGDSVFTIPAIREINKKRSGPTYIFCFAETLPIFELSFDKKYILPFQHSDFYLNSRIAKNTIRRELKRINPQKIYDLTGSVVSASILFNSLADSITGINEPYFRPVYSKYIPVRKSPHIMDIYLDAVEIDSGVDTDKLKEFSANIVQMGYIVIHPFAGWKAKEWGLNNFLTLAVRLNKYYNIIFVSEPGRFENDIRSEIVHSGIEIVETRNVYELISVLKNCALIISNDSGPVHIASSLGKPTFTIYGPTNVLFHLPYGENHDFIQKQLKCSPIKSSKYCFTNAGRRGCPSFDCMHLLEVDEVYDKINKFLARLGIKQIIKSDISVNH